MSLLGDQEAAGQLGPYIQGRKRTRENRVELLLLASNSPAKPLALVDNQDAHEHCIDLDDVSIRVQFEEKAVRLPVQGEDDESRHPRQGQCTTAVTPLTDEVRLIHDDCVLHLLKLLNGCCVVLRVPEQPLATGFVRTRRLAGPHQRMRSHGRSLHTKMQ